MPFEDQNHTQSYRSQSDILIFRLNFEQNYSSLRIKENHKNNTSY